MMYRTSLIILTLCMAAGRSPANNTSTAVGDILQPILDSARDYSEHREREKRRDRREAREDRRERDRRESERDKRRNDHRRHLHRH